jgi:hypothetical protein
MCHFFQVIRRPFILACCIALCLPFAHAQNDFYYTQNLEDNPRFADIIFRIGGYGGAYNEGQAGLDTEIIVAPMYTNFQFRGQAAGAFYSKQYQNYTAATNLISDNYFRKFMMLDLGADYFFWDSASKGTAKVGVNKSLLFADRTADVAALIRFSVAGRLGINYTRLMLSPGDVAGGQFATQEGRIFGSGAAEEDRGSIYVQSTHISPYAGLSFNLGRGLMTRVKGVRERANYHFISLYTDLLISADNSLENIEVDGETYRLSESNNSDLEGFRETRTGFRGGIKAVYGRRLSAYVKFESGIWPGFLEKRFFWLLGAGASLNLQVLGTK